MALDPAQPERRAFGRLELLGGVVLRSRDWNFGGWSDLWIDPVSDRMVMVSDSGKWLEARLETDAAGAPQAVAAARLGALIDDEGHALAGWRADAEAVVALPDGGFAVAFEHVHRIWRYPASEPPFAKRPVALAPPPGLERAPANGGIEALAALGDGRLIAFAEELKDGDAHVGWIGDGATWRRIGYRAAPDHDPTAVCVAPDGDLLVLERRFAWLSLSVRITRVPRASLDRAAPLEGEALAVFAQPLAVDNFEGIAARRAADGRTHVYIVSDDNFLPIQRTLLYGFALG